MQRFQQTTNSDVARWIARACLIAPSNGTDFEAVKRLADVALTADTNRWVAGVQALAEYRAGRFETALEWAQRSVRAPGFDHDANLQVEAFSSDGRWLVYVSNESSRSEVYVTPFPGPGEKRQVSPQGGFDARLH